MSSATTAAAATGAAYRHCETVTRREAGNFYYGIRLLPPAKRRAMCAVYAFARRIDDIGDGELPAAAKLSMLEAEQRLVETLDAASADPVIAALADAAARYPLPLGAFVDLIEGVRMDVHETRYQQLDELVLYCRRVAGSIGRLCLAIFGSHELERGLALADDLGVAMQLTNVLRDVREDAARGRVYLPAEDLERFGWKLDGASAAQGILALAGNPAAPTAPTLDVAGLVGHEAARARAWFERGLELVALLDRRSAACVLAMTGIYRRLLDHIEASPGEVLNVRMSLPPWEKAWVAARAIGGAAI